MVSVATWVVSITMLFTSARLRKYLRPRLRSAFGPVMVAPRLALGIHSSLSPY